MYNYYLTRKNIISIKISTLTCKFSNPAVINHVKVYIVQMEYMAHTISYITMIATRESGGRDIPLQVKTLKKSSEKDNWVDNSD